MSPTVAIGGVLFLLVIGIAVVAGLVLVGLVRAEHDRRQVVSREEAERLARRDEE